MDALQLTLATGDVAQAESLRSYFSKIFTAEDSGSEFPVNLEHVWRVGYSRKDAAVRALQSKFEEGVDYHSFHRIVERETGAATEEVFELTVSCLEYFVVRANRAVFDVYRACRQAMRRLLMPNFSDPVAAARAWADEREAKQLAESQAAEAQQLLLEAAPSLEFVASIKASSNALTFAAAAKWLKIPGMEGRNRLIARLKKDGILMKSREPYQQYIDAGYFEVEAQTYQPGKKEEKGTKGERLANSTRVTGKGLEWLAKRYKQVA